MHKIKPLAWEWDSANRHWIAKTPFGELQSADRCGFCYYWLPDQKHGNSAKTLEKAQAAAEQWYRAKMMEGLEVATVKELRQTIKEMEGGL